MATGGFLPNTDAALLAWSLNFSTLVSASPTTYALSAAQATAYAALHTAYATALAACDPTHRTKSIVSTKNAAKAALRQNARMLGGIVELTASVTNAQRLQLGLTIKTPPTPSPIPAAAPGLDVLATSGWTATIRLHDTASTAKRGKPPGVAGASIFSWVGSGTAPLDVSAWKFEGITGRVNKVDIVFPNTLAPGAKVWFTAFWFNGRKQSGPACDPVSTNLQGGGVTMTEAV